jgi:NAD(P)H-dependent FMN reductase
MQLIGLRVPMATAPGMANRPRSWVHPQEPSVTARAQNHLRQILAYLNMFPINQPEVLISHAMDRFDQEGNLTDAPTRQRIIRLLQNLVDWTRRIGPK